MKKSILFGLGIACITCFAYGDLDIDGNRAICEKYPEKYVWVEPTATCVPRNTCKSENLDIQYEYCAGGCFSDDKRAFEKKMQLKGKEVLKFEPIEENYTAVYTTDGYYFVFERITDCNFNSELEQHIYDACAAYGYATAGEACFKNSEFEPEECTKIADFVSDLHEAICYGKPTDENPDHAGAGFNFYCKITCD